MAKATKKHTTTKQTRAEPKQQKPPLKGLGFINAAYQRKSAAEPNLKRELKMRRQPEDIENLAALYDAYMAAVDAMMGIVNQPRSVGVDDVIDAEWNHLIAKAWTVAEHLKGLRPLRHGRETFVRVPTECTFDMGGNVDDAASVLRDAANVEVAPDYLPRRAAALK